MQLSDAILNFADKHSSVTPTELIKLCVNELNCSDSYVRRVLASRGVKLDKRFLPENHDVYTLKLKLEAVHQQIATAVGPEARRNLRQRAQQLGLTIIAAELYHQQAKEELDAYNQQQADELLLAQAQDPVFGFRQVDGRLETAAERSRRLQKHFEGKPLAGDGGLETTYQGTRLSLMRL